MSDFQEDINESEAGGLMDAEPDAGALTLTQERAVSALLSCSTFEAAAKQAGISPATLRRWRQEPAFNQAYRVSRGALLDSIGTRLRGEAENAVTALSSALTSDIVADRIRAAKTILDMAYRSVENEDLADRLAVIEEDMRQRAERADREAKAG